VLRSRKKKQAKMSDFVSVGQVRVEKTPVLLLQARERSAQRLTMAYVIAGLFFMLLPGTFLGVWNLISISGHHGAATSAAWIQAHGHAQIFGWIGTFIMGIGFYSIPKMAGPRSLPRLTAGFLPCWPMDLSSQPCGASAHDGYRFSLASGHWLNDT
jgi:hypothetical protein